MTPRCRRVSSQGIELVRDDSLLAELEKEYPNRLRAAAELAEDSLDGGRVIHACTG